MPNGVLYSCKLFWKHLSVLLYYFYSYTIWWFIPNITFIKLSWIWSFDGKEDATLSLIRNDKFWCKQMNPQLSLYQTFFRWKDNFKKVRNSPVALSVIQAIGIPAMKTMEEIKGNIPKQSWHNIRQLNYTPVKHHVTVKINCMNFSRYSYNKNHETEICKKKFKQLRYFGSSWLFVCVRFFASMLIQKNNFLNDLVPLFSI